ncbi:MAG: hypothetical protein AAGH71_03255 [Planctomycetota bacterium]
MGSGGLILIMIVGPILLILVGIVAYYSWKKEQARKAALSALAVELGLSWDPSRDTGHDDRYSNFEVFRRGHTRSAYNTMTGTHAVGGRPFPLIMGDFTYKVTSHNGKSSTTTTYRFSYLILHLPYPGVPDLLIRPEHLFDKLGSMLGFDDIDFESAEFSRTFMVKSPDRRFAYDVVTPAMMEFLLSLPSPPTIDMERSMLCLTDGRRRWTPEQFRGTLEFADRFLSLWPEHVVHDLTTRATGRVG